MAEERKVSGLARQLADAGALNLNMPIGDVLKVIETHGPPPGSLGWNVLFGDNYVLVYPVIAGKGPVVRG